MVRSSVAGIHHEIYRGTNGSRLLLLGGGYPRPIGPASTGTATPSVPDFVGHQPADGVGCRQLNLDWSPYRLSIQPTNRTRSLMRQPSSVRVHCSVYRLVIIVTVFGLSW